MTALQLVIAIDCGALVAAVLMWQLGWLRRPPR